MGLVDEVGLKKVVKGGWSRGAMPLTFQLKIRRWVSSGVDEGGLEASGEDVEGERRRLLEGGGLIERWEAICDGIRQQGNTLPAPST